MIMKNTMRSVFVIAYAIGMQTALIQAATNNLPELMPAKAAPSIIVNSSARSLATALTNNPSLSNGHYFPGIVPGPITLTDTGCEATAGRHKVAFAADIASDLPIRVTMPDGKRLAFRPTYLVLANRVTGQNLLIAEITNRIAQLIQPDRVLWTNAFDQSGPAVDVEYQYSKSGSLEQNIIFKQNPLKFVPAQWDVADVAIECWTELFMNSRPLSIDSMTTRLRNASSSAPALDAEEQDISWDSMKIVAGGRAFNIGGEQDSLPVSKVWTQVDANGETRTFLIETLDALSAKTKLDALPQARQAAAGKPNGSRSEFIHMHASTHRQTEPKELVATERPALLAVASTSEQPGVVLDFVILNTIPLAPGIISWWPACCTTNYNTAIDAITSSHNNGYLSNGVTYLPGYDGQGFYFASFTNDDRYIKVTNSNSLNPTNALTIDTWVYLDTYLTNVFLVGKDDQAANRQYLLTVSPAGRFRAHIGLTDGVFHYVESTNLAGVGWTHVAMTFASSNHLLSIYVNGNFDTSGSVTGSVIVTSEALFFGNQPRSSPYWWSYYCPSKLDEIDLWGRALSSTEIKAIYDAGRAGKLNPNCVEPSTNCVGWWAADENNHDFARTNFANLFNGCYYSPAFVSSGFTCDGVNDYAVVTNAPDVNPTNAITLETWIYLNYWTSSGAPYGNYPIISKDGCDHDRQYLLTVSSAQKFRFHVGTTGSGFAFSDGNTTVEPGGWIHVAMTYDSGTSNLILYVNGAQDKVVSGVIGSIINTSEHVFLGGAPHSCFAYYFPGLVDEPSVYNRALTATEIAAIYTAGCAGKCRRDTDNDGLTDLQEAWLGTNPNNPDTDGDSVTDGDEVFVYHTNPKN
jgi:hypothetical protein